MAKLELTPEQQAIMDELNRASQLTSERFTLSEWQARERRRSYLTERSADLEVRITDAEAAELKELQEVFDSLWRPVNYYNEIWIAKLEENAKKAQSQWN